MTEKNVHPIWSDAELDAALAELHGDPGPDDGLAFARTSLPAAAGTPLDQAPFRQAPPVRRKSCGSWRRISVAAAVAALTAGLIVVTGHTPSTVTPAATAPGLDQLKGVDLPVGSGGFFHTTISSWSVTDRGPGGKPAGYLGSQIEVSVATDTAAKWRRTSWMTNSPAGLPVPAPHHEPVPVKTSEESGPGGMFPRGPGPVPGAGLPGLVGHPDRAVPRRPARRRQRAARAAGQRREHHVDRAAPGQAEQPGPVDPDGATGAGTRRDPRRGPGRALAGAGPAARHRDHSGQGGPGRPDRHRVHGGRHRRDTHRRPGDGPAHRLHDAPKATTTRTSAAGSATQSTTESTTESTTQAAPQPTGPAQNELATIYTYSVTPTDR